MAKSKGYTNPALQALGLPALRLPSRNWSIFWAVTGSAVGLWYYDRRERKQIRQTWKDRVSVLAQQPMDPMQMPRKVTVYIAPPPGDFIDVGLSHFRNYIKPILVAGAVDYEVRSETRQGEIRSFVATEIRNKRRQSLGLEHEEIDEIDERLEKNLKTNDRNEIICIGRGAYKEYLVGLHEGCLGPLSSPEPQESQGSEEPPKSDDVVSEFPVKDLNDNKNIEDKSITEETPKETNPEEKKPEKKPIPKPYITCAQYSEAHVPAEVQQLDFPTIGIVSHPHLIGFLNLPRKIYRFYTQRHLADKVCGETAAVVFGKSRPFDVVKDANALIEEEDEWPSKWKKTALEKDSEWMQPFAVDDRITSNLGVFQNEESEIHSE